uniref:Uncharacterized protein n=1 Tax=Avena sativa TaxID=4498 RepID=A0ACD5UQ94_AVESA
MAARGLRWPAAALLLLFLAAGAAANAGGRREVVTSRRGAVAADDGRCSAIGRDALLRGGNAVDAAVATSLCLGVVSPASSGVGGGAFMLVRLADGTAVVYDSRETAPAAATKDMYGGNETLKARGALSIGVPGEIAGLYQAWRDHGKLPWNGLVTPAAKLARAFRISPYLRMQMEATRDGILANAGIRAVYAPNGDILKVNEVCRNVALARTLDAVAVGGPDAFYKGSVADQLVKDVREAGGIMTREDLEKYQVKVRRPLTGSVMGLTVLSMPPPSAGGAGLMLVLNILAQYGISGISGSLGIHRLVESLKHYMAVKMNLGDPDFVDVSEVVSDMLSPKFAAELKRTIYDNMTFSPKHYGGRWNILQDHGTSHLSIVDRERNAVSMTSTVNSYFGSLIVSPSTGVLLNNEMDDFSMPQNTTSADSPPPAPNNFVAPLKRPLSSMCPTIVLKDGKLKAAVGASGGSMIPAGTIEVLLNHFAKNMDPLSSVMAPRVYHQLIPNVVQYENWTTVTGDRFLLDAATRADLLKKGHVLKPLAGGTISQLVVHNVDSRGRGDLTAVSDPRKGGVPAGY